MSGTCGSCGQTHAALVEYETALARWSETHRAAIWDSKHQSAYAASCKRLRAATAALRSLAAEGT